MKEEKLKPYVELLLRKAAEFEKIEFTHIGRTYNRVRDALENLESTWQDLDSFPKKPFLITASNIPYYKAHYIHHIEQTKEPWFIDILRYMTDGTFSADATKEDKIAL